MKRTSRRFSLRAGQALPLLALLTLAATPAVAQVSAVPSALNFQGRLTTPSGNPVPDGTYSIRFSLWDSLSSGVEKWNKTVVGVNVKNGTFATKLDTFPANTFDGNLWLEIKIGSDAALIPRTPLVSVPYAMKSDLALTVPDGSITSAKLASGALNTTAWLLGGNSGVTSGFLGTTDTNPLVFKTNNAERMRVNADGNVGIGTSSTASPLTFANALGNKIALWSDSANAIYGLGISGGTMQLYSSAANSDIAFGYGKSDAFTENARFKGNGNVGIGTNSPQAKLHIATSDWIADILESNSGAGTWHSLRNTGTSGHNWNIISSGSSNGEGAGKLLFFDQTAGATRMVLSTNGNVGIGTANPTSPLSFRNADGRKITYWDDQSSGYYGVDLSLGQIRHWMGYGGAFEVGIADDITGAFVERAHLDSFGNLGLGMNNSAFKLSVDGDAYFTGGLSLGTTDSNDVLTVAGSGTAITAVDGGVRTRFFSSYATQAGYIGTSSNHGLIFRTADQDRMYISQGGSVGIGGSPYSGTRLVVDGGGGAFALYVNGPNVTNKALYVNGYAVGTWGFGVASDARYKQNVATFENALDTILNLRGVTYEWKRDEFKDMAFGTGRQVGFIAQEIEKWLPELVATDPKGYKSVNYSGVVPILVEAVKTLKKDNDAKDARISELEKRLDAIERALAEKR